MATTKKDNIRSRKPDISSMVYGKVPPQAPLLEEAVLGAIMLEQDKLDELFEIIQSPEVFYVDAHQKIFTAIKSLNVDNQPIDLLTVTERLRKQNELELIGGAYYLTKLTMSVVSSAHVEAHARIVVEKYLARELIRISGQVIGNAYEDSTDVFDLLEHAENQIYEVANMSIKKHVQHIKDGMPEIMAEIDEIRSREKELTGLNTGFESLNRKTGGWQKSDLIILAARPSVGKTAFSLNAALYAASDLEYGGPVAVFNLEMSAKQVRQRLLSALSGIELDKIRHPHKLLLEEIKSLNFAVDRFKKIPIFIDDTAGLTVTELRAKARRLKQKHDIQLIIVDYLQLMEGEREKGENREQQISKISRSLKKLAKDLDIPVIALSQMVREVDKQNREPVLSDLRESGAIEQDADMVMFFHRPNKEELKKNPSLEGKILGTIAKHRQGALGDVTFRAENTIQRWKDWAQADDWRGSTPTGNPAPVSQDDLPF